MRKERQEDARLYMWRCPECGEQMLDSEYDVERGRYYGHYHDRPADWAHDEDPWFDAVKIEVRPASESESLRRALEEVADVLGTGECSVNGCEGCAYEAQEAASIVRAALSQTSPDPQ